MMEGAPRGRVREAYSSLPCGLTRRIVVPLSLLFSTVTLPPWSSITRRTMNRPRPCRLLTASSAQHGKGEELIVYSRKFAISAV